MHYQIIIALNNYFEVPKQYLEQSCDFPENYLPNFAATKKTLLLQSDLKEAFKNEKNFSTFNQEKKKQTWFQEKDVDSRRTASTGQKKGKGQEETLRLG
jgi:hypothetical protein